MQVPALGVSSAVARPRPRLVAAHPWLRAGEGCSADGSASDWFLSTAVCLLERASVNFKISENISLFFFLIRKDAEYNYVVMHYENVLRMTSSRFHSISL